MKINSIDWGIAIAEGYVPTQMEIEGAKYLEFKRDGNFWWALEKSDPFKCSICNKAFGRQRGLISHIGMHKRGILNKQGKTKREEKKC